MCSPLIRLHHLGPSRAEQFTTGTPTGSMQEEPAFTLSKHLSLSPHLSTASVEERTAAVAKTLAGMNDAGVIDGWRDELYPVASRCIPAFLPAQYPASKHQRTVYCSTSTAQERKAVTNEDCPSTMLFVMLSAVLSGMERILCCSWRGLQRRCWVSKVTAFT